VSVKGLKAFVTGGSGAVGRNLVPYLAAAGMEMRVLKHDKPLPDCGAEVVVGDIRNFQDGWLDGIDVVFHLAAETVPSRKKNSMYEVNAGGTAGVVRALRRLASPPRLVFTSSVAVFGPCLDGTPMTDDSPPNPITGYGRSKVEAEAAVLEYPRSVIVRFPMVVGPGDRVTARFAGLAGLGIFPVTPKRFCAIDARDAVRLLLHLADGGAGQGCTYTVSDGEIYSWKDVARHFGALQGRKVFTFKVPDVFLTPGLFRLAGNEDAACYLKHDWTCRPSFPPGFAIQHKVFDKGRPQ